MVEELSNQVITLIQRLYAILNGSKSFKKEPEIQQWIEAVVSSLYFHPDPLNRMIRAMMTIQ